MSFDGELEKARKSAGQLKQPEKKLRWPEDAIPLVSEAVPGCEVVEENRLTSGKWNNRWYKVIVVKSSENPKVCMVLGDFINKECSPKPVFHYDSGKVGKSTFKLQMESRLAESFGIWNQYKDDFGFSWNRNQSNPVEKLRSRRAVSLNTEATADRIRKLMAALVVFDENVEKTGDPLSLIAPEVFQEIDEKEKEEKFRLEAMTRHRNEETEKGRKSVFIKGIILYSVMAIALILIFSLS